MTRFWVILTIPLLLGFVVVMLFIHAQPYDDSKLREFLTPPQGCSSSCFMGIQPGVTTVEEAVAILKSHEWVEEVHSDRAKANDSYVEWSWSGLQPSITSISNNPYLFGHNGIVTNINIPLSLPMAEIWWLYGQPITESACKPYYCVGKWYFFLYPQKGFSITTTDQDNCMIPLDILLAKGNTLRFQSVKTIRTEADTNDYQGFQTIPFSWFNRRKTC